MLKISRIALVFLLLGLNAACSSTPTIAPSPEATEQAPMPDLTAEAKGTSVAATQRENEARATEDQATKVAQEAAATNQAATQVQDTAEALAREATQDAATAAAKAESTAQAQSMLALVQELYTDGHLSTTAGTYYSLEDFDESWAQINWYMWWYTGYTPTDFVIRANAAWDSASTSANWWTSGCGFVFREDGVPNHYLAYLGLDGYVYFARTVREKYASLGTSYYGRLDTPKGQAQIMLVVDGTNISFFVNGERVHTRQDQGLNSGNLALTLLSGINTGFGTRCQMSNIELWELD
jgi:hypothetical protein